MRNISEGDALRNMELSTGGEELGAVVEGPVSGDTQPAQIARRARCIDIAASSDGTCVVIYE